MKRAEFYGYTIALHDPAVPGGPWLDDETAQWPTLTQARFSAAEKCLYYRDGRMFRAVANPVYAEGHPELGKSEAWRDIVARRDARKAFMDAY